MLRKFALIPQPLLPFWEKGSRIGSPSPALGEGFRVRVTKVGYTPPLSLVYPVFAKLPQDLKTRLRLYGDYSEQHIRLSAFA
jgi:hypothetical protein